MRPPRGGSIRHCSSPRNFENQAGLGGKDTIRERISVLATKGYVKFVRDGKPFGLVRTTSKFGYLCIEGMVFGPSEETVDPNTGEVESTVRAGHAEPLQVPAQRSRAAGREPFGLGLSGGRSMTRVTPREAFAQLRTNQLGKLGKLFPTTYAQPRWTANHRAQTSCERFSQLPPLHPARLRSATHKPVVNGKSFHNFPNLNFVN